MQYSTSYFLALSSADMENESSSDEKEKEKETSILRGAEMGMYSINHEYKCEFIFYIYI